jgi:dynein heavy chain
MVWEFKDTIPVVVALRSQYLQPEHWIEIKALVKADFDVTDSNFSL